VHKITKQVQGGWEIEMRETTKNSKEETKQRIESQRKGEANARYGKQQLDIKKSTGFQMDKDTRNIRLSDIKKQMTAEKLKGPIAIPMFTTNPYQHARAHQLAWLPLHNKEKERATKATRRKHKRENKENEEEDTNWHPIGNLEGVGVHHPEGLRKQLNQWEAEAEEMRHEGDIPTLLLGSDASKHPVGRPECSSSRNLASDRSRHNNRIAK
jgi:hypothetical protein